MGMEVAMVTGDQELTARVVARSVGITEVYAGVSPRGKTEIVKRLQAGLPGLLSARAATPEDDDASDARAARGRTGKVAFVGDGVNDSPALALSDCGIAVSNGTDIAMETADIVLVARGQGDGYGALTDVIVALDLSRTIFRRIRWNFAWALLYNAVFIPVAMGMFLPWGVMLHPMLAGATMAFSSVSVVCSSLALKWYKRPRAVAEIMAAGGAVPAARQAGLGVEMAALGRSKSSAFEAAPFAGPAEERPGPEQAGFFRRASESAKALLGLQDAREGARRAALYKRLKTSADST
ncbi:MAG: HAD-like domain-containing protein [Olpidium bornovanus]|uniref:HAD-like domain-containing protein n=1 Tax=Olpidium bornovanus TaxID=278681 RepID=A0A8H7ZVF3_9FUNG|nr:MAG: HAD-like domain-containing protein [Olpidium bornovanus]